MIDQFVAYEAAALEGGGLSWSDFQAMTVAEFIGHLIEARRRLAGKSIRLVGAIGMFSPHFDKGARSAFLEEIRSNRQFGEAGDNIREVYEGRTVEERLRIIGSVLNSSVADAWRRANHGQLEWLRENGLTEDDARKAHRDWKERGRILAAGSA